jgi:hypothetical protein
MKGIYRCRETSLSTIYVYKYALASHLGMGRENNTY